MTTISTKQTGVFTATLARQEYRHEVKYEADYDKAMSLKHRVAGLLAADEYTERDHSYTVKSVYFDTPYNNDYLAKELGLQYRQKVRLRTYGEGGVYRLEIKSKNGQLATKYSVFLSKSEAERVLSGDYSPLAAREDATSLYIYHQLVTNAYRPLLSVFYKRYAYTLPGTDLRLTFDIDIRYGTDPFAVISGRRPTGIATYKTIIELKYGSFAPNWLSDMILTRGVAASENSKYNTAFINIFD